MSLSVLARELALIQSSAAVLGWDQETYLPPAAAPHRAEQLAWLSAQAHQRATSDEWRAALEQAETAPDATDPTQAASLREMRRQFDRATRLPVELVARVSRTTSLAKRAWAEARQRSDFSLFAPHLQELLDLARQKADLWGYEGEPYDALLAGYERATSTAAVAALFDSITPPLREIAAAAVDISAARAPKLPPGPYPIAAQQAFNAKIAEAAGYDFSAGRVDTTTHPFCTTLGPADTRITTRYDESDFTSSLFGVLHETGHALYNQGLPREAYGLPAGTSVSLGIHESQSRLWENHIGRSRAFWEIHYPAACDAFPALRGFPLEHFLHHVRRAAFSPIRVEADEATYDLHILLRFDLERRMLRGELAVADIPAAWNEGFRQRFGFLPPDDRRGCLQDIHWAMGGLGYFPTYSLGNLHAAQLFATAMRDESIAAATPRGDYAPLLAWLRHAIHRHGALLDPAELIESATGRPPAADDYLRHLAQRYLHGAL
jgi:carboxypeptidase Taq